MFKNKLSCGKHMVCDICDIKNKELLNSKELLKEMLNDICIKHNFKTVGELDYSFPDQGCTILFLLSESHISIHTFPERNHISFDIYTCHQYENNKEFIEIFNFLINSLQASMNSEYTIVDRNFSNNNKKESIYLEHLIIYFNIFLLILTFFIFWVYKMKP